VTNCYVLTCQVQEEEKGHPGREEEVGQVDVGLKVRTRRHIQLVAGGIHHMHNHLEPLLVIEMSHTYSPQYPRSS
jgi:hypothetical protein